MKLLKQAFFTLLLLACFASVNAQTPSHYRIGEEELSGIDIYDILQDNNRNYWLATDNGIIKYDGYTFKTIKCDSALSNSVFDLKIDYQNNIYCKNLSGQIFQIINDSCKVYFQIPDSLMATEVFYAFDKTNQLIIATNSIFTLNKKKEISFLIEKHLPNYFTELFTLKDSSIVCQQINTNQFVNIKNNQLTYNKNSASEKGSFYSYFYLANKLHYYNISTGKLLDENNGEFYLNNNFNPVNSIKERLRYYSDNENLWVARQAGGAIIFNKNLKPLFNKETMFKNHFISTVYNDHEENTLLGTFGEGIIIVPNLSLIDIKLTTLNSKISRITSTPKHTIFLGSQNGQILQIDSTDKHFLFWDKQNKNIEVLEYLNETNDLIFDEKRPTIINLKTRKTITKDLRAIKDIVRVGNDKYIIASNVGVSYFYPTTTEIEKLTLFNGRTNCVNYDANSKTIYAGTALGLKFGNEKFTTFFKLNNQPIICRDILYHNKHIYITTQKNGILIFKNNKLVNNWNKKTGFPTNSAKHIKAYKNCLYISTDIGVLITTPEGKILSVLNKSEGLYTNKIIDFELRNDMLWLVHQKGIQKISIANIKPFNYSPTILLNHITVNDSILSHSNNNIFNYNQNKFSFFISSSSVKYKDEIIYLHQLVGIDNGWQVNNYNNNKIEYKSLPTGNYVFQVKAKCRNQESEIVYYKFSITPPLWKTWWFYLLVIIIFISITFLIFKHEIKKQRKKIQLKNELNASKLIAIQSQMNPHFIFNAINSIQDLILQGDIDNSYHYIIKFSKLVRQTLNFSDKEFIDIEDEIDLLKIYLELEKLRFKADFEYSIHCDVNDTQVPPMLIQPFVENAIKHGLLHKEGLKRLDITFKKDTTLYCTVTDNGIGRKKAQEIKDRRQKGHQSFSVNATRSRFEIMKSHYQQDLGVKFEDLMDNGEASGTKVIINMPFKQNY